MTDHENTGAESMGDYSLDDETQLQSEDTLDDRGVDDILDEGYSPPEKPLGVDAYGTTLEEQRRGGTIDQELAAERPDPAMAVEDPLAGDGDEQDPDAVSEEDEFLDDGQVGDERSGRLVSPDEGAHEDREKDMVAQDVGIDGAAASAEEAAVHIVEE